MVAITGGPCAGKSSALDFLRERFNREGISARFVPEAATDLILAGIAPWTCDTMLDFQTRVMHLQIERENEALNSDVDLVVCDRGICDSHAYLSDADYERALEANGLTNDEALARYAAVFHLDTVAKTDSVIYAQGNNSARFEDAGEAIEADARVRTAWAAHPRVSVIGNEKVYEQKARKLGDCIMSFVTKSGLGRCDGER